MLSREGRVAVASTAQGNRASLGKTEKPTAPGRGHRKASWPPGQGNPLEPTGFSPLLSPPPGREKPQG